MSTVLQGAWYVALVALPVVLIMGTVIIIASHTGNNPKAAPDSIIDKISQCINTEMGKESEKDRLDWNMFRNLPLAVKVLVFPYFGGVCILLLFIIRKARLLFVNFKNGIVFNRDNVGVISSLAKLLIGFSVLTVSFSTFLISIIMLMLCEIIKNGATLQEEHDLTI